MKFKKLKLLFVGAVLSCTTAGDYKLTQITSQQAAEKVILSQKVTNNLAFVYGGAHKEIPLCLKGIQIDNAYIVIDTYIPFIEKSTRVSAVYNSESCYDRYFLGMAHNHPNGTCNPSITDLNRFNSDAKAKIEIIVCGINTDNKSMKLTNLIKK